MDTTVILAQPRENKAPSGCRLRGKSGITGHDRASPGIRGNRCLRVGEFGAGTPLFRPEIGLRVGEFVRKQCAKFPYIEL